MTKKEVKDYLKENLLLVLEKTYENDSNVRVTVSIFLENDLISKDYVYITEGNE